MTVNGKRQVIKIGGSVLDDVAFVEALAGALVSLTTNGASPPVVVHGGGKEVTHLQRALDLEPRYVDGLRITDEASLAAVTMALCGTVNKRLVSALVLAGLDALGMSGMDRGLVRVEKLAHPGGELGRVGIPVAVRGDLLEVLLGDGVMPVLAPVCLGPDGAYNVNADHVAGAVAAELDAALLFVTDVPGVLVEGELVATLPAAQAQQWMEAGVIEGGMLPKVGSALAALEVGVPSVRILSLSEWLKGGGTTLVA